VADHQRGPEDRQETAEAQEVTLVPVMAGQARGNGITRTVALVTVWIDRHDWLAARSAQHDHESYGQGADYDERDDGADDDEQRKPPCPAVIFERLDEGAPLR
jgi:hypothetical protein